MNDDLRFDPTDPVDRELQRRFDLAAHGYDDPDVVLDALRPGMRRAQARRRVAMGGITAGVLAVVAVGVLSVSGSSSQSVHTPPAGHSSDRVPTATSTTQAPDAATPGSTDDHSGTDSGAGSSSSSSSGTSGGAGSTPAATSPGDGGTATPTPPAATTTTYTSGVEGGSITVSFANGVVSLVTSTPTAGYTASLHDNGPSRVEVRFNNGSGEWRIRVDVVNGALVPEITHSGG